MIYSDSRTNHKRCTCVSLLVKVVANARSESDELLSYEFPHLFSVLHPQTHTRDLT